MIQPRFFNILSFVLISIVCFAQDYPTWIFNNQSSCAVGISLPAAQDAVLGKEMAILIANFSYGLSNERYNEVQQLTESYLNFTKERYDYEHLLRVKITIPQIDSIKYIQTLTNGSVVTLVKYTDEMSNNTISCDIYESLNEEGYNSRIELQSADKAIIIYQTNDIVSYGLKSGDRVIQQEYPLQPNHLMARVSHIYDGGYDLIRTLLESVELVLDMNQSKANPQSIVKHTIDPVNPEKAQTEILSSAMNRGKVSLQTTFSPIDKVHYTLSVTPTVSKSMKMQEEEFRKATLDAFNKDTTK